MHRLPRDVRHAVLRYARPTVERIAFNFQHDLAVRGELEWILGMRVMEMAELRRWKDCVWDLSQTFLEVMVNWGRPRDARALIKAGWVPSEFERCNLIIFASGNPDPVSMLRGLRRVVNPPRAEEYSNRAAAPFQPHGCSLRVLLAELRRWNRDPKVFNPDGNMFVSVTAGSRVGG